MQEQFKIEKDDGRMQLTQDSEQWPWLNDGGEDGAVSWLGFDMMCDLRQALQ